MAATAFAHEGEIETGPQSCAGPVPWEQTLTFPEFAGLAAVALAGLALLAYGLAGKKRVAFAALGAVLAIGSVGYYVTATPGFNPEIGFFQKGIHEHADLKVFVYGKAVDFSKERFESSNERSLSEFMHFHNHDGDVIHIHATKVPLSYFFRTFNATLDADCVGVDARYCSNTTDSLKFYVNGKAMQNPGAYVPKESDRILISFGPAGEDVSAQLENVTSNACIYSGTCPRPPGFKEGEESCSA